MLRVVGRAMPSPEIEVLPLFADGAELLHQAREGVTWDRRIRARLTASFGLPYDYSGLRYAEQAWPTWLESLRGQVERHVGHPMTNCLANFYVDGASTMGFHADSYERLVPESRIAIVSAGAARTLRFRAEPDRSRQVDYRLEPGSLVTMNPCTQQLWRHAVLEEAGAGERISFTFRYVLT